MHLINQQQLLEATVISSVSQTMLQTTSMENNALTNTVNAWNGETLFTHVKRVKAGAQTGWNVLRTVEILVLLPQHRQRL